MASKLSEPNRYISLKKSIVGLRNDITFLKKCRKLHLTPVSHKIRVKTPTPPHMVRKMESEFIKASIKNLYSKLETKTLECYSLHLELAKKFVMEFPLFLTKVKVLEDCEYKRKRALHNKKLRILQQGSKHTTQKRYKNNTRTVQVSHSSVNTTPMVQSVDGFVVNRSTQQFSEEQLTLLNKGLGYAITTKPDVEQAIIDIETAITHTLPIQVHDTVRNIASEVITNGKGHSLSKTEKEEVKILKELREKSVYYTKADKGNAVVILDKEDYDNRMSEKINNGPYRQLRVDPLPTMVKHVEKTLKECKSFIGDATGRLKVSNPILPRIKGLPKIHKAGNEMREIISAEGSPTQKLAKWLVNEFQNMPKPFSSRSVSSTQEFASLLQASGEIQEDEVMVSFDVTALFPSVPVKEAISLLEDWLLKQSEDSNWKNKVRSYLKLTRLCMEENYFVFRGNFYKQTKGAPMGNPLSPFLCELFMANLENILKDRNLLPKRWYRYVDDIFSIVKREDLPKILEAINSIHRDIKFTHEEEADGKLPFLDLLIIRETTTFDFEIYRKPTNTKRVIPSSSNHSHQHKMAAFHHMIHRMQTLPLGETGKLKETNTIFEIARVNGYQDTTIQAIIDKKARDHFRRTMTTLTQVADPLKRVAVNFDRHITKPLRAKLRNFGIDLVFSSRNNQLKSLLGSTKDPINVLGKAGVYKISCPHCEDVYIGQTRRTLEKRFKEHIAEINKAKKDMDKGLHYDFRSKVAEHIFSKGHDLTKDNINILRNVSSPWKLDVAESLEIYKHDQSTLLNRDQGNGYSRLFGILPKNNRRGRSSRSAENEDLGTENI